MGGFKDESVSSFQGADTLARIFHTAKPERRFATGFGDPKVSGRQLVGALVCRRFMRNMKYPGWSAETKALGLETPLYARQGCRPLRISPRARAVPVNQ